MTSIVKEIVVETSQERAFRVFTDGIDRWWPRSHHIGASPLKRFLIEPKAGGRWYSICEDGSEQGVGQVLAWEPPARLVLAWQITADWKYDPSFSTEVEVTFVAEDARRTRVHLEHRQLERYGERTADMVKQFDNGGWASLLELYGTSIKQPKFVLIYETTPESLAKAREHFAGHRDRLDAFNRAGTLLMAGNLLDGSGRALGIFTTQAAAEAFVAGDPFVLGGVVAKSTIAPWNDVLY